MRPIQEGDIVDVFWAEGENLLKVKILSMPSQTGDLMYVEKDGDIYGINTSGSSFDSILKRSED